MNVGSRFWLDVSGFIMLTLLVTCLLSCDEDDSSSALFGPCTRLGQAECGENLQCVGTFCKTERDPLWLPGDPICPDEYWYGDIDFDEEDCEVLHLTSGDYWSCEMMVCLPGAYYFGDPECEPGQGWDAMEAECEDCLWPLEVNNDKGYPQCLPPPK